MKARIVDFYADAATVADCHVEPREDSRLRPTPSPANPPRLSGFQDAMAWLARETPTLLAVLDIAARNGLASQVARLAPALNAFLTRSGQRHERAAVHRTALAVAPDDHARLVALTRALARLARFEAAEFLLDEAAELAGRRHDNDRAIALEQAYVCVLQLQKHRRLGQYERAIQCFGQSLALERALNDRYWEAHSSHQIGNLHHLKGERDRAATAWKDAAAIFEDLHHPEGAAVRAKLSETS